MAISKKQLAQAATDSMFTEAPKGKAKPEKRQQATPEPKRETATFSVKIDSEVLKRWRIYASMNGYGDKGKLTSEAVKEYMKNHPLSKEQESKIKALMDI